MVRRRLTLDNAEGLFWLSAKLIGLDTKWDVGCFGVVVFWVSEAFQFH